MTDAQIFQLLGIIYLAVGLGMLINPDFYKKMITHFMENPPAVYMGGLAALVIGFLLITFHNSWVRDWPVIITIIGWAAFIKGLFLIILPKVSAKICNAYKMEKYLRLWAVVVLILGALLCGLGFFATT